MLPLSHVTSCTPIKFDMYFAIFSCNCSVTLSYTGNLLFKFQISCPFSIAYIIP